jgi:hypothetical protein
MKTLAVLYRLDRQPLYLSLDGPQLPDRVQASNILAAQVEPIQGFDTVEWPGYGILACTAFRCAEAVPGAWGLNASATSAVLDAFSRGRLTATEASFLPYGPVVAIIDAESLKEAAIHHHHSAFEPA